MTRSIFVCGVLAVLTSALPAQAAEPKPVDAQVLADTRSIAPGQPFTLGVLLKIASGWHIYWKNPGDAGAPTEIRLDLPRGFVASDLRWPVPTKFTQPGDIVGYGYENAVLLTATITPPKDLQVGQSIDLSAQVHWLSCRDVCIPGDATLRLSLPVAGRSTPANSDTFNHWRSRLPLEAASPQSPVTASVTGSIGSDFTITLQSQFPLRHLEWFPAPEPALEVSDTAINTAGPQPVIRFKARPLGGQKLLNHSFESVAAFSTPSGQRQGIRITVPLKSAASQDKPN